MHFVHLDHQKGVILSGGQLAGLIIGFLCVVILVAVVAVILTRRQYVGRFGNQTGAVKFQEDEVCAVEVI